MDEKTIEAMAKAFVKSPPSGDWSKLSDESKEVIRVGMRAAVFVMEKVKG